MREAFVPVLVELSENYPIPWLDCWMWDLLHEEQYERSEDR